MYIERYQIAVLWINLCIVFYKLMRVCDIVWQQLTIFSGQLLVMLFFIKPQMVF